MAEVTADPQGGEADPKTVRRAVMASAIGNAVEWYDYGVFTSGVITATVGTVFFPASDKGTATLQSLGLLAIGFIVRPLGGFFFGPLGDKLGRQRVLALTILLMSGSTFLVGVLPPYAAIGVFAPMLLLLLRLIQSFSTGGEYGGAATFIAEYAPTKRRGFFGSFLEFGTLGGFVLGNALVLLTSAALSQSSMNSWGWRIPFLLGLPLGLIGLYLRSRLEDTPTFRELAAAGKTAQKAPLKETLVGNWRMILNLIGIVLLLNVADYLLLTTMPSYFTTVLHVSDTESALIIIGVELVQMAVIVPIGAFSDRIGRKPILITAAIGFIVLSWPALWLMQQGTIVGLVLGFVITALMLTLILAVIASTFPAMFPTRVRYGSFAIGYNLSTSIFGGTTPFIVTALIHSTGNNYIPAYYLIIAGLIGLVPILLIPETAGVPMNVINTAGSATKLAVDKA